MFVFELRLRSVHRGTSTKVKYGQPDAVDKTNNCAPMTHPAQCSARRMNGKVALVIPSRRHRQHAGSVFVVPAPSVSHEGVIGQGGCGRLCRGPHTLGN